MRTYSFVTLRDPNESITCFLPWMNPTSSQLEQCKNNKRDWNIISNKMALIAQNDKGQEGDC